jgi:spoIIIJ-associated protein
MTSTEPTSAAVDATAAGAADAESHEVVEDAETEAAQTSGDAASAEDLAESASEVSGAGDGAEETDAVDSGETDDGETENPLEVEAEVAADYLEELLDIADLDGDIDTYVDGDRAHVSIVSESTTLVGRTVRS